MTIETKERTGVGLGRGGRMSRKRKRDAGLRLLRGADLEILSRALGVTAATLSGWQDSFVAAGTMLHGSAGGRSGPPLACVQAIRTDFGRPNSSMRFRTATAKFICVALRLPARA